MIITDAGLSLTRKLLQRSEKLVFSRVAASTETVNDDPTKRTELTNQAFPSLKGLKWEYCKDDIEILIRAMLSNEGFILPVHIRELGVFANDPDGGEILYAIDLIDIKDDDGRDTGIFIPAELSVPYRHNFELYIEIRRDIEISVEFISNNFLTIEEADGNYWRIGTKYPATEIYETTGETTEEAQRRQDEQLHIIEQSMENGTTRATQVDCGTHEPLKWKIINYNGYYDSKLKCFRAGGKYIPQSVPEPQNPSDAVETDESGEEPDIPVDTGDNGNDETESVVIGGGGINFGKK